MASDGQIWIKIAVQGADKVKRDLDEAGKGVQDFGKKANASSDSVAGFGERLKLNTAEFASFTGVVGGAGAALMAFHQTALNTALALTQLSKVTGVGVTELQNWHYAAMRAGVATNEIDNAITKFSAKVGMARDPTSEYGKIMSELGISVTGKTTSELFDETIKTLTGMEDVTRRNYLAMKLYEEQYAKVLAAGEQHAEVLKNQHMYYTMSAGDVKTLTELRAKEAGQLESLGAIASSVYARIGGFQQNLAQGNFLKALTSALGVDLAKGPQGTVAAVKEVTDTYKGLSDTEIAMFDLRKTMAEADERMRAAKLSGDQITYTAAEKAYQVASNQIDALTASMTTATAAAVGLKTATSSVASSLSSDWASGFVGSAGSNMQLFMQAELNKGKSYQEALQAWSQGAPSNNYGAGFTAGGMGMAAEPPEVKANNKVKESLTELADAHTTTYTKIEEMGLTHYNAMSGYEKVYYDTLMKHHQTATDYISNTVQWVQQISVVNGNPLAEPRRYVTAPAPVLEAADYSGIKGVGAASAAAAIGGAGGVQKVQVEVKVETEKGLVATTNMAKKMGGNGADYSGLLA